MKQQILQHNPWKKFYSTGILLIVLLPLLTFPPLFYPSDWGKPIVLRCILAILIVFLTYQILWKKIDLSNKITFLKSNKIFWAIGATTLIFFISTLFSVDPQNSFWASPYRGGGLVNFIFYFVFALVAFLLLEKKDWHNVWIGSLVVGVIASLIAIIQFYGIIPSIIVKVDVRPSSTMGNPIFLAVYLMILFFITLTLLFREHNSKTKAFYAVCLLLFSYAILLAASRAAFLGIIAGSIYFVFFYPKKHRTLKISLASFLAIIAIFVALVNIYPAFDAFLSQIKTGRALVSRLSIATAMKEERFFAWQIATRATYDKPILGYGFDNVSIGFDKYYDPMLVYDPWWDRAHNIFLDLALQVGYLGLISYLVLFGALLFYLYKVRRQTSNEDTRFMAHGALAALIAYFVANIFSFDSFGTYLMFAILIGYTLFLIFSEKNIEVANQKAEYQAPWPMRLPALSFLILLATIFVWQYNLSPLFINSRINTAIAYSDHQDCENAIRVMREVKNQKSFIDSYLRMMYIKNLQACVTLHPGNSYAYAVEGEPILEEGTKLQPTYTRFWMYLGSYKTLIANQEPDTTKKEQLFGEARKAFDRAEQLSPKHQEILVERAKLDMISDDYKKMKEDTQRCAAIKPDYYQCHWFAYLADILLGDKVSAEANLALARKYDFDDASVLYLYQLITVHTKLNNYTEIVPLYERLIGLDPLTPEYRSSLAFAYYKLGQYQKARQQAMEFLRMAPQFKSEVDAFLQMLPY